MVANYIMQSNVIDAPKALTQSAKDQWFDTSMDQSLGRKFYDMIKCRTDGLMDDDKPAPVA